MDFQNFKYTVYSVMFNYLSNNLLIGLCLLISFVLMWRASGGIKLKVFSAIMVLATSLMAFFGARIFHVLIERRELLKTPNLIFSQFDGMTFNGSIFFGLFVFYFGLKYIKDDLRKKYWDLLAVITALSYGILRIGCFTNGCCWGKVSSVPWSVKYFNNPVMPWWGIPAHPVQLYDSAMGFTIFIILLYLKRKPIFEGKLLRVFLGLYAIGRFFTEFYRGDALRGENIFGGLSTSQCVSIGIIGVLFVIYIFEKYKPLKLLPILIATLVTGCLPQQPEMNDYLSIQRENSFEIYHTKKNQHLTKENVLFLAGDDNVQFEITKKIQTGTIQSPFLDQVKEFYNTSEVPRIEDVVFWDYLAHLKNIYNVIVKIPVHKIGYNSFTQALELMESLGNSYDIILLTHGSPNMLSTGQGYFYSLENLKNLSGRLNKLNLVVLQSCYGHEKISKLFLRAGAKYVISFSRKTKNYFFIDIFLNYYYPNNSVKRAYDLAIDNFDFNIRAFKYSPLLHILFEINNLQLKQLNQPTVQYNTFLDEFSMPILEEAASGF